MYSSDDIVEHIVKLAKKGLTPSKIGVCEFDVLIVYAMSALIDHDDHQAAD